MPRIMRQTDGGGNRLRDFNHARTHICLTRATGLSDECCRVLDQTHRKRNLAEYEGFPDQIASCNRSRIILRRKLPGLEWPVFD